MSTGDVTARTLEVRQRDGAPPPEALAKLRQIAQGFESLFTSTLLGELMKPLDGGGLAGEGPGASVVQGMIETHLADHVAKSGGFGIGRMVMQQLEPLLSARKVSAQELASKLPLPAQQSLAPALSPATDATGSK
jgi:Rod binding domain-containing protein